MVYINKDNQVQSNQVDKFNQFLAQAQSESDPYDIDLQSNLENVGHAHVMEGTVFSACGCLSQNLTMCGCG
jgi:hypothetical protein